MRHGFTLKEYHKELLCKIRSVELSQWYSVMVPDLVDTSNSVAYNRLLKRLRVLERENWIEVIRDRQRIIRAIRVVALP